MDFSWLVIFWISAVMNLALIRGLKPRRGKHIEVVVPTSLKPDGYLMLRMKS